MNPLCPLLDKALGVQSEIISPHAVLCLITLLCPTLHDPMDCSPPGSSFHGASPGKKTGVGCQAFLQEIIPTQGSNPGFPHCRQLLYQLSHRGSPRILEWVAYPFSRGTSQPRNWTQVSCIASQFFPSWAIKETLISPHSFLLLTFSLTVTILFFPLLIFMLLDILIDEEWFLRTLTRNITVFPCIAKLTHLLQSQSMLSLVCAQSVCLEHFPGPNRTRLVNRLWTLSWRDVQISRARDIIWRCFHF